MKLISFLGPWVPSRSWSVRRKADTATEQAPKPVCLLTHLTTPWPALTAWVRWLVVRLDVWDVDAMWDPIVNEVGVNVIGRGRSQAECDSPR